MVVEFLKFIFAVAATYFFSTFIGYFIHKLFHQSWAGFTNRAHMTHHIFKYPPKNLISDEYRSAGKDNTVIYFIPVVVTMLSAIAWGQHIGWLSLFYAIFISVEIVVVSLLHEFVHASFHLERSIFHCWPGYGRLRELHFIHHSNMKKNFGILDFIWDYVFGTFIDKSKR